MGETQKIVIEDTDGNSIEQYGANAEGTKARFDLDMSNFIGKTVTMKVFDMYNGGSSIVDDITFFNDVGGCIPECLKFRVHACSPLGGIAGTCFYFGEDPKPYQLVAKTSELGGTFCRADTEEGAEGSEFASGLAEYSLDDSNMALTYLPRCMSIAIDALSYKYTGDHKDNAVGYEISTFPGEQRYEFEEVISTNDEEGLYCVYGHYPENRKPACATVKHPLQLYKGFGGFECPDEDGGHPLAYEQGCHEYCIAIHCDPSLDEVCGSKAFEDCAKCCHDNGDVNWEVMCMGGSFGRLRNRRLTASLNHVDVDDTDLYTCAELCIRRAECASFEFQYDKGTVNFEHGTCRMSEACTAPEEMRLHDGLEQVSKVWVKKDRIGKRPKKMVGKVWAHRKSGKKFDMPKIKAGSRGQNTLQDDAEAVGYGQ